MIAPYRAQVDLLRKCTRALGSSVEVNTVDQYQGRDKDAIIYSCTRSARPTVSFYNLFTNYFKAFIEQSGLP